MTKTPDELAHKFPQFDTETLRREIASYDNRVVTMQRSKAHASAAGKQKLSELQSTLHRMRLELKRREGDEKRARYAITPSAR